MNKPLKVALLGCGALVAILLVLAVAGVVWLASGPEGGVRMSNEMEDYALKYIEDHKLLAESEKIIAYYDVTLKNDGTEAAILTTQRLLYHKSGRNESINLTDIADVKHRKETLIGDVIEVASKTGKTMKIEIAPLNQGEAFLNALKRAWEGSKK